MEEALIARLTGAADIAAIVADRVAWFERPRAGGLSAITLTPITVGEDWTHDGPDGLDGPTIQFDIWGRTSLEALALERAVRAEMETVPGVTVGGWLFHPASLERRQWSVEDLNADTRVYRIQHDYEFYHQPA